MGFLVLGIPPGAGLVSLQPWQDPLQHWGSLLPELWSKSQGDLAGEMTLCFR